MAWTVDKEEAIEVLQEMEKELEQFRSAIALMTKNQTICPKCRVIHSVHSNKGGTACWCDYESPAYSD